MKIGQEYWTYYRNDQIDYVQVLLATFKDDMVDKKRLKEGRVFTSKNKAEQYSQRRMETKEGVSNGK